MRLRTLTALAVCVCATTLGVSAAASDADHGKRASRLFIERVQAYVSLQRNLDRSMPPQKPTSDLQQIAGHQTALADGIAAARHDSRQGDIFIPEVTTYFRAVIREAFKGSGGRRMRRTLLEGDPAPVTSPHVNEPYPENVPVVTMPLTLLGRLPALPAELAYRIVGRTLVLKDVRTNVIVDVMPDAIPGLR